MNRAKLPGAMLSVSSTMLSLEGIRCRVLLLSRSLCPEAKRAPRTQSAPPHRRSTLDVACDRDTGRKIRPKTGKIIRLAGVMVLSPLRSDR